MATGDLEGNLERLRVQLRTISYPHPLDMNGLREGNPASILPLLHYALLGYSRHVSRYLSESGYALFAKSDLRFVECTLKYLREEHAYRCPLTVAQTIKRNTTLCNIVKNIDASNVDVIRVDDTLSMALDKISQAQRHANDIYTRDLKLEATFDNDSGKQTLKTNPSSKAEQNLSEKKEMSVREMDVGSKARELDTGINIAEQQKQSPPSNVAMESTCDVDASLSQCYDKLRTQIVEVAEKMERLLLTLKGDVQRITSDMQVKVSCLEKKALYLGQAVPSMNLARPQAPWSYNAFQPYQRSFPFNTTDASMVQNPFLHTTTGIDSIQQNVPQTQSSTVGDFGNHHEELSTEKLIAAVKARCNKTKELLSETEWIGPT